MQKVVLPLLTNVDFRLLKPLEASAFDEDYEVIYKAVTGENATSRLTLLAELLYRASTEYYGPDYLNKSRNNSCPAYSFVENYGEEAEKRRGRMDTRQGVQQGAGQSVNGRRPPPPEEGVDESVSSAEQPRRDERPRRRRDTRFAKRGALGDTDGPVGGVSKTVSTTSKA